LSGSNSFPVNSHIAQRVRYSGNTRNGIQFNFVLPDSERFPAKSPQLLGVPLIPFAVAANLVSPEGRQPVLPDWKSPSMPEIAVDEDGHPGLWEDEIRTPRERAIVLAEFEPGSP
jgi:hypothetical protein